MKQFALLSELNLRIKQQNYNADKIFELIGNGCYSKPFTIPASYLLFSFSKDKNQNTQVLSNLKSCVNEGHVDHITGLLSIYLKQNNLIE
jgi:hypothetical protein